MFRVALILFQLCGFYPVEINKIGSGKQPGKKSLIRKVLLGFWSFINSIVVLTLILYMAINNDLLYAATPIGQINDILLYFSLVLAHLSIILESFMKRKYFANFWIYYERLIKIESRWKRRKWIRILLLKMIFFVMFSIITEIFVITNIESDKQWTNFWYATVFSLLMTRNRHLQNIFFIDVIFFTLEDMNSHLRTSIAWAKAFGDDKKISQKFLYREVERTMNQFKNLMEMLICVNRIFCWSQVFNIGQHFIEVTSELYWVFVFATGPQFLWRENFHYIKEKIL